MSLDESRRRFTEGLSQVTLLLKEENVSATGEFNSFKNVTSLPRPTQMPHPPFWIAATNTPETFAFAGTQGCKVMAIPLEPTNMRELIGRYRDAWRAAGHPGNGHVMNTFFMCCMPTRDEALATGLPAANRHLKGLAEFAKEWISGSASTKDYPGYDKLIAHVSSDTAERQVRDGSAFIGAPADIVEMSAPARIRSAASTACRCTSRPATCRSKAPSARCGCSPARSCRRWRGCRGPTGEEELRSTGLQSLIQRALKNQRPRNHPGAPTLTGSRPWPASDVAVVKLVSAPF